MDWDKLKIFHTVAEASSFTKASTILNLSQSAISRQIQSLENDLKIKLFVKKTTSLKHNLTPIYQNFSVCLSFAYWVTGLLYGGNILSVCSRRVDI